MGHPALTVVTGAFRYAGRYVVTAPTTYLQKVWRS